MAERRLTRQVGTCRLASPEEGGNRSETGSDVDVPGDHKPLLLREEGMDAQGTGTVEVLGEYG